MLEKPMQLRSLKQKYKALVHVYKQDPFCEHLKQKVEEFASEIVKLTGEINKYKQQKKE